MCVNLVGLKLANDKKFEPATADLEKALNINSEHKNARQYMIVTLLAWGNSLKDEGDVNGAREKFEKVLAYEGDPRALKALEELDAKAKISKRKASSSSSSRSTESSHGSSAEAKRKKAENAAKLREMEEFIKKLKA
ncbi:hypothetical protein L596_008227 [Steinernema carpocapsae]|uniref:Uncharacterized protein n=1 Tax=Steinernema carpocapsae TaxID=34508 RepID=A0A4U5PBU0_STECR|nr:hypothetical protein L596_008227 [Steinernema carpocapsae]